MRRSYITSAIAGALVLGLATATVAATKGEFSASGPPGNAQNGQGNQSMKYHLFSRGLASVARATAVAAALCFAVSAPLAAADQPPTNVPTVTPVPPSATTPTGAAAPASSGPTKDFTEDDVN